MLTVANIDGVTLLVIVCVDVRVRTLRFNLFSTVCQDVVEMLRIWSAYKLKKWIPNILESAESLCFLPLRVNKPKQTLCCHPVNYVCFQLWAKAIWYMFVYALLQCTNKRTRCGRNVKPISIKTNTISYRGLYRLTVAWIQVFIYLVVMRHVMRNQRRRWWDGWAAHGPVRFGQVDWRSTSCIQSLRDPTYFNVHSSV